MIRRILAAAVLAAAILFPAAPAHADTCGDTAGQWVPLLGSTWTGTITTSSDTLDVVAEFASVASAAAVTVDTIPMVGTWVYDYDFRTAVALEGFGWLIEVSAVDCDGGMVIEAQGGATSTTYVVGSVSLDRVT